MNFDLRLIKDIYESLVLRWFIVCNIIENNVITRKYFVFSIFFLELFVCFLFIVSLIK